MKCNQSRPGFELVSPCPFPTTITITPRAPPIYIYMCVCVCVCVCTCTLIYIEVNNGKIRQYGEKLKNKVICFTSLPYTVTEIFEILTLIY